MASRRNDVEAQARAFFQTLSREGVPGPVILIQGEERFLVREAIQRIIKLVFPQEPDTLNFETFQAEPGTGTAITDAASQLPMFAAKRLVVARGLERFKTPDWEAVATYAANPNPSSVLVLEALTVDGRLGAVKRLLKAPGLVSVTFDLLKERDTPPWVVRQAKSRGLELSSDQAVTLVHAMGSSLGQLDMALERLDLYMGSERRVSDEAIDTLIPDSRSRDTFELLDHLGDGNFGASVDCFSRMLEDGKNSVFVLGAIGRLCRQLAQVQSGDAQGLSDQQIASRAGCPPFVLGGLRRTSRRFGPQRLQKLFHSVAATDQALKLSRVRPELLMERLFLEICHAR